MGLLKRNPLQEQERRLAYAKYQKSKQKKVQERFRKVFTQKKKIDKSPVIKPRKLRRELRAVRLPVPNRQRFTQERYPMPINQPVAQVQPSLKEMSILERTPVTLSFENTETFIQRDLMSGRPTIRKIGNLL